ncbi:MAG TPA: RNA methyltransferase [Acidimicrobiales bacterium]|nr:RNA methyltransferase [Acidimicrobiales bacterium]
MIPVSEGDDERLAGYRHLIAGDRSSRHDRRSATFVVEGARAIGRLLEEGWPTRSVLLSDRRAAARPDLVEAAEAAGVDVFVAPRDLFDGIAGYPVHRGALALAERPPERRPGEIVAGARLVLVVEAVNDFENLGALFRNAAAFGAGAVLLDPRTADPLYRRCVRVSLGQVLRVPFARVGEWPSGLETLTAAGFTIVALTPAGDVAMDQAAGSVGGPVAVMVGSEADGLTPQALSWAGRAVRIPMAPGVDSLNVATAAAIGLHRFAGAAQVGPDRPA